MNTESIILITLLFEAALLNISLVSFSLDSEKSLESILSFSSLGHVFHISGQSHWSVLEFCDLSNGQIFFLGCDI